MTQMRVARSDTEEGGTKTHGEGHRGGRHGVTEEGGTEPHRGGRHRVTQRSAERSHTEEGGTELLLRGALTEEDSIE